MISDIQMTSDSVEVLLEAKEIITRFLEIRGLTLSDEKTIIPTSSRVLIYWGGISVNTIENFSQNPQKDHRNQ